MPTSLTPEERTLRSRIAAHESWARTDDRSARTAKARAAFASKFEQQVDPDRVLDPVERAKRAEHARKAHFTRLALASAWDWQTLGIDPPVHAETGEPVTSSAAAWTREAKAVLDTLDELHAAHNYDDSDTMTDYFDVKFYGTVAITVTDGTPNHMTRETTS